MSRLRAGNVVVITGASTGIGRAAALEFAKRKTRLVLGARSVEKLEETAAECREAGAECIVVSSDVTKFEDVEALKDAAIRTWGRLDVWVNNAGIAAIGSFTEVPLEEHRRVLETNVMGYVHGAHVALKIFRQQKSGTLINNGSIDARLATPYMSSYVASKFAVRGLTHALRQDLALEGYSQIEVCQINPGVTETPAFEKAGNFSGRRLKLGIPKATPEKIARAMVRLVDRPRREVFVGPLTGLGNAAYTFFPSLTSTVLVWMMRHLFFRRA